MIVAGSNGTRNIIFCRWTPGGGGVTMGGWLPLEIGLCNRIAILWVDHIIIALPIDILFALSLLICEHNWVLHPFPYPSSKSNGTLFWQANRLFLKCHVLLTNRLRNGQIPSLNDRQIASLHSYRSNHPLLLLQYIKIPVPSSLAN